MEHVINVPQTMCGNVMCVFVCVIVQNWEPPEMFQSTRGIHEDDNWSDVIWWEKRVGERERVKVLMFIQRWRSSRVYEYIPLWKILLELKYFGEREREREREREKKNGNISNYHAFQMYFIVTLYCCESVKYYSEWNAC